MIQAFAVVTQNGATGHFVRFHPILRRVILKPQHLRREMATAGRPPPWPAYSISIAQARGDKSTDSFQFPQAPHQGREARKPQGAFRTSARSVMKSTASPDNTSQFPVRPIDPRQARPAAIYSAAAPRPAEA